MQVFFPSFLLFFLVFCTSARNEAETTTLNCSAETASIQTKCSWLKTCAACARHPHVSLQRQNIHRHTNKLFIFLFLLFSCPLFADKRKFTLHCPNTAVRLVSSGRYDNSVEFAFNFLDAQTLSNDSILVCQQPN